MYEENKVSKLFSMTNTEFLYYMILPLTVDPQLSSGIKTVF